MPDEDGGLVRLRVKDRVAACGELRVNFLAVALHGVEAVLVPDGRGNEREARREAGRRRSAVDDCQDEGLGVTADLAVGFEVAKFTVKRAPSNRRFGATAVANESGS